MCPDDAEPDSEPRDDTDGERQRVVRVPGARRVRLTPAPGTTTEPVTIDDVDAAPAGDDGSSASGPNDDRMRRDVPPHY